MAAVELGALRYMTKPADPEELLQAMGEASPYLAARLEARIASYPG